MNEITMDLIPRFKGMVNAHEFAEVTTQLVIAKELHPKMCRRFDAETDAEYYASMKRIVQKCNDSCDCGNETGYDVLMEEVFEAFEAVAKGDWSNAYTEFAQVAAVAVRLMEKVRKEHLERKDGEE